MALRIGNITFDCDDALVVGTFWSRALGRELDPGGSSGYCSIGGGDAKRSLPAWYFEKVAETKSAKNRMHLDLVDPDPSSVERLVSLGATVESEHEFREHHWTVMHDPEGNEFCVASKSFVI
jgi:hypothetical protein